MSIESPPDGLSLEDRFDKLAQQAEHEIAEAILTKGKEPNLAEARLTAQQVFEDRVNEANELYTSVADSIGRITSLEMRQVLVRGLLGELAYALYRDGYMREVTAKRLAAVIAEMRAANL